MFTRTLAVVIRILSHALHCFFGFGSCCRFTPTCSKYAREALEKHGFLKGALLVFMRFLRCHPLGNFGEDPVPEFFRARR